MTGAVPLTGVFPMLPTPFDAAGAIVWDDLDRLVAYVLAEGVDGIAALGLGGESARLSVDEREQIAARVLVACAGRAPVIIGASARDTETACRLTRHAAAHGAAVVMVAPPDVPGIARDALRAHYMAVAAAAGDTAVMIQDAPAFIGVALDAPLIGELTAACATVRYAKSEAVPAGPATARLATLAPPERLAVFGGHAGLYTIDALDAGAVGMIPGAECPRELVAIVTAWRAGRRDEAVAAYRALLPLLVFQIPTLDFYLACSKTILMRRGVLTHAALRAPWPLDGWSERALARYAALTLGLDWAGEMAAADAAGSLG